jgi:hypothetical protein
MVDQTGILIDNLKETFKAIERFLFIGSTASLVLIVLAITDREFKGVQKLMLIDTNAPAALVAAVALATYFVSGAFAAFYFLGRRSILKKLRELDRQILDSLLTYPSVVAKMGPMQITALMAACGNGLLAFVLLYAPTREIEKAVASFIIIGSPYIVLFGTALLTCYEELRAGRG